MNYYTYIDWTLEDLPRPFYVGKGSGSRIRVKRRNWKHHQIQNKFGIRREIVFESDDVSQALAHEIELIAKHHTFVNDATYNGIGCNFTAGGEGGSNPSERTRTLIADSNRRRRGEKRSVAAKKHIRDAIRASVKRRGKWSLSDEHKRHISEGNMGHAVSVETKEKLRKTSKQMHQNPNIRKRILDALRNAIAISVLEIDPLTQEIIKEHITMNAASKSANLTVKYLRQAMRNDDQIYLVKRTGRKWKYKK